MMAKREHTVEVAAAASGKTRAVSALAAHALLALILVGSFQALAPAASAADVSTPEASSQETASGQPASVDSLLAQANRALEDRDRRTRATTSCLPTGTG
jgi:enhancing lycopene biosynthesis protein 2